MYLISHSVLSILKYQPANVNDHIPKTYIGYHIDYLVGGHINNRLAPLALYIHIIVLHLRKNTACYVFRQRRC